MNDYEVISEEFRTARIPHKCSLCKKDIKSGTQYFRIASVSENTIHVIKCHVKCHDDFLQKYYIEAS
jgi:hypothetical protein